MDSIKVPAAPAGDSAPAGGTAPTGTGGGAQRTLAMAITKKATIVNDFIFN